MVPVPNTGLSQLLYEGSGVGQRALSCGRDLLLDYDNAYLTWKRTEVQLLYLPYPL
jgi:hypothetical protein